MTASPKTKATRAARQISAVARHRLASQPAVISLAASMAAAMAMIASGAPGNKVTIPLTEKNAAAPARATAAMYAATSPAAPWRRAGHSTGAIVRHSGGVTGAGSVPPSRSVRVTIGAIGGAWTSTPVIGLVSR